MAQYTKVKCVFCGYEMATKAKVPRCYKCGSRRLNPIDDFESVKPFNQKSKVEVEEMPKKTSKETTKKSTKKAEPKAEPEKSPILPPPKQSEGSDFWGDFWEDDEGDNEDW